MITLCNACGTSWSITSSPPARCAICADARQFVPKTGQQWVNFPDLIATHTNKWQQHEHDLLSMSTVPEFAIGQRAFLLRTPEGNILWDCIANLDDATKTLISALGGLKAIAISHPHFYTTLQDWAAEFEAPVYLHASDRQWIMRDSPYLTLWEGDSFALNTEVSILRTGGHFPGSSVLHWSRGNGALFTGDTLQVTPGANAVSFMWSYPNMLPLPGATVSEMVHRLEGLRFAKLYGGFEGREITEQADDIVRRSAEMYIACLEDTPANHCR